MKRNNLALEELSRQKEKFYEEEVRAHDREQKLRREIKDANRDLNETNKALDSLVALKERKRAEPRLSEFYKPSSEMRWYQCIASVLVGLGCGYGTAMVL